jgi:protein-arginine kinase activator protein McsA
MTEQEIIEKIKNLEHLKSENIVKGYYERAAQIRDEIIALKKQLKKDNK